jgi:hypothetical protein
VLTIILVASLITYRITRFLISDSLIATPRIWLHQVLLGRVGRVRQKVYELINCPYCLSVWIAAGVIVGLDMFVSVPLPVAAWLATCAGCMMVWAYVED